MAQSFKGTEKKWTRTEQICKGTGCSSRASTVVKVQFMCRRRRKERERERGNKSGQVPVFSFRSIARPVAASTCAIVICLRLRKQAQVDSECSSRASTVKVQFIAAEDDLFVYSIFIVQFYEKLEPSS